MNRRRTTAAMTLTVAVAITAIRPLARFSIAAARTDSTSIRATVVNSARHTREAGVWVIAETHSLPTPFRRIVVTDDQGRFLVPALPAGAYDVWVRGYGLRDSAHLKATPGERL